MEKFEKKLEIFQKLRSQMEAFKTSEIASIPTDIKVPLSYPQEQLWLAEQLEGEPIYYIRQDVWVKGTLDKNILFQSLIQLMERHQILKSYIEVQENKPYLSTLSKLEPPLFFTKTQNIKAALGKFQLHIHEIKKKHALEKAPLWEMQVFQENDDNFLVILIVHHILADAQSMDIWMRDLGYIYQNLKHSTQINLPNLTVQYRDFAYWQRQLNTQESFSSIIEYWKKQLTNAKHSWEFECNIGSNPVSKNIFLDENTQHFLIKNCIIKLSSSEYFELRKIANNAQTTLFTVLLSLFNICFYLHNKQDDLIIGTAISQRSRPELENLIGLFTNTLPIRNKINQNQTFFEFLLQVRQTVIDALSHQDIPFTKLVEYLQPERIPGKTPFFNIMFVLHEAKKQDFNWGDIKLHVSPFSDEINLKNKEFQQNAALLLPEYSKLAKFDMTISAVSPYLESSTLDGCKDSSLDFYINIEYRQELFDSNMMENFARHFKILIKSIIADPKQHISEIDLLEQEERKRILALGTAKSYFEVAETIHGIFEKAALEYPENIALDCEETLEFCTSTQNRKITYYQLNQKANQLANFLREKNIGPENFVVIFLDRSPELIISILGILKAGAAYIPIDPCYPKERIQHILSDLNTPFLITSHSLANKTSINFSTYFSEKNSNSYVYWEDVELENYSSITPKNLAIPENLAYMIYTSGSTGKPKGVPISHANVVRLFLSTQEKFQFNSHDTHIMFHSCAFDFSVWEIWGALFYGGTLILVSYSTTRDAEKFYKLLHQKHTTILNQTPSAFRQLSNVVVEHIEKNIEVQSLFLRTIIFGGEALDLHILKPWIKNFDDNFPKLINMYGITETTVHVTYRRITKQDVEQPNNIPSYIGQPLDDLELYLLDDNLNLVPYNVIGELYVGGSGLSRGYWNRPELTAERFIPNPFSKKNSARLYKSGDIGRYLSNGDIEYLGRRDQQVKIRGFRVELGEISAAICENTSIEDCIVIVQCDEKTQDKKLVAYIVSKQPYSDIEEIKKLQQELLHFLRSKLPEYMIPTWFITIPKIPLTTHGKCDVHNLPDPKKFYMNLDIHKTIGADTLSQNHSEMQNFLGSPISEIVAIVWQKILGRTVSTQQENFFESGGHSLLATQFLAELKKILQYDISLRLLLEHPNFQDFVHHVIKNRKDTKNLNIVRLPKDVQAWPLSSGQQRLYFLQQLDLNSSAYNMPGILRLEGHIHYNYLEKAFQIVAEYQNILRITISSDEVPYAHINPSTFIKLRYSDLSRLAEIEKEQQRKFVILQENSHPFNLSQGPLLRLHLLNLGNNIYDLVVTIHHIICDGWSLEILFQEVVQIYQELCKNSLEENKNIIDILPMLPIQYGDFAAWQQEWLQSSEAQRQIIYWQKQLSGSLPQNMLPLDYQRSSAQNFLGNRISLNLNNELSQKLREFSIKNSCTLYMTLLAGFSIFLHRLNSQNEIIIGSPIAGRQHHEVQNLIGFFVNTLVLRIKISEETGFEQLLQHVRELTLDSYSNQDIPYEKLVAILQPERNLATTPLFQVMFNYMNFSEQILEIPGLKGKTLPLLEQWSKFDLTLYVYTQNPIIQLDMVYNKQLFRLETIQNWLHQFSILLKNLIDFPLKNIDQIPLQTLEEISNTKRNFEEKISLDLNQVSFHPHPQIQLDGGHVLEWLKDSFKKYHSYSALQYGEIYFTYQEINHRTNQIAQCLLTCNSHNNIIAVLVQDRAILAMALIACLKAGKIFMPLHANFPQEKIFEMLNIVHPDTMLCDPFTKDLAITLNQRLENSSQIIQVEDWQNLPDSDLSIPSEYLSRKACYLYFTSGSTADPKAILGQSLGLSHFLKFEIEGLNISSGCRVAQLTMPSVDVLLRDVLAPLCSGGTVVIPKDDNIIFDMERLAEWLENQHINILHCVPSLWAALLHHGGNHKFLDMRFCLMAGEIVSVQDVDTWYKKVGNHVQLVNLYGATETNLVKFFHIVQQEDIARGYIPVGKPMPGVTGIILNTFGEICAPGELGEIYIRTPYLSLGYYNNHILNKKTFLHNLFHKENDIAQDFFNVYRTGDQGRIQSDETYQFLGRKDSQIKIHGLRIDPIEIEENIKKFFNVQEAIVILNPNNPEQLLAYITSSSAEFSQVYAKEFLRQHLPEYMIPKEIILLPRMPYLPGGKINRQALPIPYNIIEHNLSLARNPIEETLSNIFKQILNKPIVFREDNFFDLGGHSLLITQVLSRIRRVFGTELPLRTIFEHPTIESLARQIHQHTQKIFHFPPLTKVKENEKIPASFAQKRLWFLQQLQPNNPSYNIVRVFHILGNLNKLALQRSLNYIVQRHSIFSTRLEMTPEGLVQYVKPQEICPWKVTRFSLNDTEEYNFSNFTKSNEEDKLNSVPHFKILNSLKENARKNFDFSNDVLLQGTLAIVTEKDSYLLLVSHHIALDGSLEILLKELAEVYKVFQKDQQPQFPPIAFNYQDFSIWQQKFLSGEILQQHLEYWKNKLQDAPNGINFPTDFRRPNVYRFQGKKIQFNISQQIRGRLQQFSQRHNTTLFMSMLAAFTVLLQRYSLQDDIIIGTPISTRDLPEFEPIIGSFVNTLVLRCNLTPSPNSLGLTWRELLYRIRETTLEAYQYRHLPFEMLIENLSLVRNPSQTPLFNVMFVVLPQLQDTFSLSDVEFITPISLDIDTSRFDILTSLRDHPNGMIGTIEYNSDIFDKTTIQRFADNFIYILQNMLDHIDQNIQDFSLLNEQGIQKLQAWNNTSNIIPNITIPALFERSAHKKPENIAIYFGSTIWTYRELNERSNQLAHCLKNLGIGRGDKVAVYVERSPEMIQAVLSILKAGAAYIPLETFYPKDRISWILNHLQINVVITLCGQLPVLAEMTPNTTNEKINSPNLSSIPNLTFICLDENNCQRLAFRKQQVYFPSYITLLIPEDWQKFSNQNLENNITPDDLAYIIFTSGSSGSPKGVMVQHRPVINVLNWINTTLKIIEEDCLLFVTSICFDLSVYDIFGTLAAGASIHIAQRSDLENPECLVELLVNKPITIWDSAPAALGQLFPLLANETSPTVLRTLRLVLLSGDWIPVSMPSTIRYYFPLAQVVSLGGATEATIWSNYYIVHQEIRSNNAVSIPYGKPISNARYYILDENLNLCPPDIPGDLYIGDNCLALGYVNDSELTAQKYIPDPFHLTPGKRMYATGDRARYRSDGNMEFLGRKDQQLKILGFRIEPGEIESLLLQHPHIQQALVVAKTRQQNEKYLVGYVVLKEKYNLDSTQIQEFLKAKLPDYMIPKAWAFLEQFPLTSNGKIDRKSLPDPKSMEHEKDHEPRNAIESQLLEIWKEVLGITQISIYDTFFSLGGNSLNLTQVMAQIQEKLNMSVTLRNLFEYTTIATLSEFLIQKSPNLVAKAVPKVATKDTNSQIPLEDLKNIEMPNMSDTDVEKILRKLWHDSTHNPENGSQNGEN